MNCHVCKKTFFTTAGLIQHYITHCIGTYQCRYCVFGTMTKDEMHRHYVQKHTNRKSFAVVRVTKTSLTEARTQDEILSGLPIMDIAPTEKVNVVTFNLQSMERPESVDIETLIIDDVVEERNDVGEVDPLSIEPEVAKDSDLVGAELYRCGTADCRFASESAHEFKLHLFTCDVLKEGGYYNCVHCSKKFKYPATLTDHIKVHGALRYSCSMCEDKAPVEHVIVKHMKVKHKIQSCKMVPVVAAKTDSQSDSFVAVPSYNRKKVIAREGMRELLEDHSDRTEYGPDEINWIPRQAIYSHEIKCAKCGYSTKVRTNLLRHLQAHLNSEPVPESAPVNPVPCLEKNEKMFDKMLNLANSSNTRMGARERNTGSKDEEPALPEFIPPTKRFVCGAEDCHYLTHSDSMLKYHFTALHSHDGSYKCPHCLKELLHDKEDVTVDKIIMHYRLHDLHLYKCSHCPYVHHLKGKIEKHLADKHPDRVPYIHIIREMENENDEPEPERDDKQWKCGFCRYRSSLQSDIKAHVAQSHGVKSQYKCNMCSYKSETAANFGEHVRSVHGSNAEATLVSAYYRADSLQEKTVTSTTCEPETFDTTPLWRRDKGKVKNIRGILLEETTKSPKRKEPAKVETVTRNLFDEPDKKDLDVRRTIGDFGSPVGNKFACPFCKEYRTALKRKFVTHVFKELKYNK